MISKLIGLPTRDAEIIEKFNQARLVTQKLNEITDIMLYGNHITSI